MQEISSASMRGLQSVSATGGGAFVFIHCVISFFLLVSHVEPFCDQMVKPELKYVLQSAQPSPRVWLDLPGIIKKGKIFRFSLKCVLSI